ncbi:MAG TPA: hypothetical protein VJ919_09560, partial [Tangfeifania sp.]|nr:hypothetical protein [Tangfeifania sp.]
MKPVKLITGLFFASTLVILMSCQGPKSPAVVTQLKCEFQENPIGIDRTNPMLQWKMEDERRGAKQTAYQVIVSSSLQNAEQEDGDVWNTEQVSSDQSVHVRYEGPQLQPTQKYFWRVRVWDKEGVVSGWSEPASWETGLMNESNWQAEWIARSAENPGR